MDKKFAIILARVSTESQDYQPQINELIEFAKNHGYSDFKIISTKETGLADLNEKVGTNEMFEFIQNNPEYNTVFATEMSRLGRRQSVLQTVKEWFELNKVQLYVHDAKFWLLSDDYTITPPAQMAFTMQALLAESEIRQKKERFRRKKKELMANGLSFGSKVLFGYELKKMANRKNAFAICEPHAAIIRTIYDWYLNGFDYYKNPSIRTITLECIKKDFPSYTHSKRNVNKLLKEEGYTGFKITNNRTKNPMYGKVTGAKEYIVTQSKIKYPQIISRETFDLVQKKLKENRSSSDRKTKHTTILSKLIQCPACSRKLSPNYRSENGRDKSDYRCTSRTDANPCDNTKAISMNLIDSAVWCYIKTDFEALSRQIIAQNPNLDQLDLKKQESNLLIRKQNLSDEVDAIKKSLSSISKLKNIDFSEHVDSQSKKLRRIDREIGVIDKEITQIRFEIQTIENRNQDTKSVVKENLASIESSREQVKRYINHFIELIKVQHQDRKYTVLELKIVDYSKSKFMKMLSTFSGNESGKYTYLIIDKRVTRDIKIYSMSQYGFDETHGNVLGWADFFLKQVLQKLEDENFGDAEPLPFNRLKFE